MTDDTTAGESRGGVPYRSRRRTAVRVAVPVAVAGVVAAGFGLGPALADDGAPVLPALSAEQVVAKALGSQAEALSGTVEVSADLGVPSQLFSAAARGAGAGGTGSGGTGSGAKGDGGSSNGAPAGGARGQANGGGAAPEARLAGLLGGDHTLRVAVDGPDRQRIGLIEDLAEYTLVHNGDQVWAWDSATNEAVHLTLPQGGGDRAKRPAPLPGVPTTPQEAARQFLTASAGTTSVTVDGTADVAGQKAYRLSVKPTQQGSTIGEVRIAVAADNGVPLAVKVLGSDGGTVFDVHFKDVSFARPAAKTFDFSAPKGARVTERRADAPGAGHGAGTGAGAPAGAAAGADGVTVLGEGWTTVLSTRLPDDGATASKEGGRHGGKGGGQGVAALVKSLGKPVAGGTLVGTKVLNALVTEDGRVFAGAVTLPVLQSAAGVK